jgi:hypothetical protein
MDSPGDGATRVAVEHGQTDHTDHWIVVVHAAACELAWLDQCRTAAKLQSNSKPLAYVTD